MSVDLKVAVAGDGQVDLEWTSSALAQAYYLLIVRTGAKRAYTSVLLSAEIERYCVSSLSRHQRYQLAVLGIFKDGAASSPWISVTPRSGLAPRTESDDGLGIAPHVRVVEKLMLMPQDRRLTAFWELSPGFADKVVIEVLEGDKLVGQLELEPEVRSCALCAERGLPLANGRRYQVRLSTRFAGLPRHAPASAICAPAAPGEERSANHALDQSQLVFPALRLSPELALFPEEAEATAETEKPGADILCCHCGHKVLWEGQRLLCSDCRAEFIQNGEGEYLELARLRFGTCRCCAPARILVQPPRSEAIVCSSSGKEHLRVAGSSSFRLIEDLPFGLCQCCRPRQPLLRSGTAICCAKSKEPHRAVTGRYVLVPTEMVFDAKAIDELMDAGLADICQAGVSRARGKRR
jgi:DNA-directed RNA polymerase subunit RPC12/RpoP